MFGLRLTTDASRGRRTASRPTGRRASSTPPGSNERSGRSQPLDDVAGHELAHRQQNGGDREPALTRNRRDMSSSSGLPASSAAMRGSSAIPQIGQEPGRIGRPPDASGMSSGARRHGWFSHGRGRATRTIVGSGGTGPGSSRCRSSRCVPGSLHGPRHGPDRRSSRTRDQLVQLSQGCAGGPSWGLTCDNAGRPTALRNRGGLGACIRCCFGSARSK